MNHGDTGWGNPKCRLARGGCRSKWFERIRHSRSTTRSYRSTTSAPAARRDRWLGVASFAAMLAMWLAVTGSGLWPPFVRPRSCPRRSP